MRPYIWTKGSVPPEERILNRLQKERGQKYFDSDVCWIWPGATAKGYGVIRVGSRQDGTRCNRLTHIVMWESEHGPVPDGKELHHRCMTPLCCNPAHLSPVTHRENTTLVTEATKEIRRKNLALARIDRWV